MPTSERGNIVRPLSPGRVPATEMAAGRGPPVQAPPPWERLAPPMWDRGEGRGG